MANSEQQLVSRLVDALERGIGILNKYENGWGKRLAEFRVQILEGDPSGLTQLRRSFGTIGSLNDICITRDNGYNIRRKDVASVNDAIEDIVWELGTLSDRVTKPMIIRIHGK